MYHKREKGKTRHKCHFKLRASRVCSSSFCWSLDFFSLVVGSRLCSMRYALRGFWLWLCPATCVASMCGCIQNKKIPAFRGGHARATARKKETQAGTSDLNWGLGLGLGGALGCKSRVHKCRNKCKCKCKCKCKGAPRPKLPRQKKHGTADGSRVVLFALKFPEAISECAESRGSYNGDPIIYPI